MKKVFGKGRVLHNLGHASLPDKKQKNSNFFDTGSMLLKEYCIFHSKIFRLLTSVLHLDHEDSTLVSRQTS